MVTIIDDDEPGVLSFTEDDFFVTLFDPARAWDHRIMKRRFPPRKKRVDLTNFQYEPLAPRSLSSIAS